jgi:hypothetical protein
MKRYKVYGRERGNSAAQANNHYLPDNGEAEVAEQEIDLIRHAIIAES